MAESEMVKTLLTIEGIVQGVGFRPFVARLARASGLRGTVQNALGAVRVVAIGPGDALDRFMAEIQRHPPPGSHIAGFHWETLPLDPKEPLPEGFRVIESSRQGEGIPMPSPDLALCDECLRELFTPGDPRTLNPFISCTHCGPRFSMIKRMPYDRETTSMAAFPLCPLCAGQYQNPEDRRFHAQTLCCNECGPRLCYHGRGAAGDETETMGGKALPLAIQALNQGEIVAVKGIGGYHLACLPTNKQAVAALRRLKGREHKPFAVMFETLASLSDYCDASPEEEALLLAPARPIVLLRRKESAISPLVYGASPYLGAFLPYTPLQHLLLCETGPLVMTSANSSSLPIIRDDDEMLRFWRAHPSLSGVLSHDRAILRRLDDSVAMVSLGQPAFLRRARGYVPQALPIPGALPVPQALPVLACGAQEKSTVCLAQGGYAYLSTELGELDSREVMAVYHETIQDMEGILGIAPALVVCDLHPGYASVRYAKSLGIPVLPVQHHHAHIASVMAEHALTAPILGVAFDGTGYGADGSLWGGEFLLATPTGFTRLGHLKSIPYLGGDPAVRQGWKSAACLLHDAGLPLPKSEEYALIQTALANHVNVYPSSSIGRMFDGVSAILGICQESHYGGQCAMELESAATGFAGEMSAATDAFPPAEPFPFSIHLEGGQLIADLAPAIRALYACREKGDAPGSLAFRFHLTIARLIAKMCGRLSAAHGIRQVALSGGVFQNRLLLTQTLPLLEEAGLTVFRNQQVPAGDGGLSLGQIYIGLHTGIRRE